MTVAMDNSGNNGKDVSTTTAMMPVQRGRWHGHNNGKDTSNRGNVLGNIQLAQRKEWGGGYDAFATGCRGMKALFGDGGRRRQERGVNTTISQKRDA